MSGPRVRYHEAPVMVYESPTCSACYVTLDGDGDGWECRVCRTTWGTSDYDEQGMLWPDWSGEGWPDDLDVTSLDDGHKIGLATERRERDAFIASLTPRSAS